MRFPSLFAVLALWQTAAIIPAIAQTQQDDVSNQAASVPSAPRFAEQARGVGIAQRLDGNSAHARGRAARPLSSEPGDEILVLEGHTAAVNAVDFSPDGARIATGSDDNTAIVWDAGTGEQAHLLAEHSGAVNAVFFSPSGNTTWTGSSDAKVIIWNTSGESTWTGEYPRAVSSVALSPDGTKMLVGTGTSLLAIPPRPSVYLYDLVQGGNPIHVLGPEGNDGFYTAAVYSPTQDKVLTSLAGVWSGHSRIWNAESGDLLLSLDVGRVTSAAFSPDGTQALTGSRNAAKLWNVETGELIREFRGHGGAVTSVAFSPDGTVALTGSADRTARLWDVATGEHLLTFSGHTEAVNAVAFSPDGSMVLTGSEDKTARLWDSGIQGTGSSPAAPEGLTATPGDGEVTLTWEANAESNLASYQIYRGTDPAPTTQIVSVGADANSYTDTDLIKGTTYYYRLKAVDDEGNASGFSEEASVIPRSANASFGTTVITHGLNFPPCIPPFVCGDDGLMIDQSWMLSMASAIVRRVGRGGIYVVKEGKIELIAGDDADPVGENVVVFDWLEESSEAVFGFAEAAADVLAAKLIEGAQQDKWSLSQLHFIGHSRGAVVLSEVIQRLSLYAANQKMPSDVVMDQDVHFTPLDAHPWDRSIVDDVGDLGPVSASDHRVNQISNGGVFRIVDNDAVVCWENVAYLDNYWHQTAHPTSDDTWIDINGLPKIKGCQPADARYSLNHDLSERRDMGHGGVHAWYHGTVDLDATDDGSVNRSPHIPGGVVWREPRCRRLQCLSGGRRF